MKEKTFLGAYNSTVLRFDRNWDQIEWSGDDDDVLVEKPMHINRVNLNINGSDIDSMASADPTTDFFRTAYFADVRSGLFDNSINYKLGAANGLCFFSFDFTTNFHASSSIIEPVIRNGNCRLTVEFNKPTIENLIALVYFERPSMIKITEKRGVDINYLV